MSVCILRFMNATPTLPAWLQQIPAGRPPSPVQPFSFEMEGKTFHVFCADPEHHSFRITAECTDPDLYERAAEVALDKLRELDS